MSKNVENYLRGVLAFVGVGAIVLAFGTVIIVIHNLAGAIAR
jgi:hypothetical protein